MSKDKKRQIFHFSLGYIGILSIFAAFLRYSTVIDDEIGRALTLIGIICLGSYIKYVESQLRLTRKENLVFKSISFGGFIIIFIIGLFFII